MATLFEEFRNRMPGAPAQQMPTMGGGGNRTSTGAGFNSKPFGAPSGTAMGPRFSQQGPPQRQAPPPQSTFYPSEGGEYKKPPTPSDRLGVGMQPATMQLLKGMQGMSGQEQQSYLGSMQQNLTQRLQRYQVLMARGFGEEMDDTAKRDYQSIMKSLTDVNKMMNSPDYMANMMQQYTARPGQTEGERFIMRQNTAGGWYS